MVVKILHQGKELSGYVIYNFKILSDVILIKFDHCIELEEKEVLLKKEKGSNEWVDVDKLECRYPDFFAQLRFKLRNVFREASWSEQKCSVVQHNDV